MSAPLIAAGAVGASFGSVGDAAAAFVLLFALSFFFSGTETALFRMQKVERQRLAAEESATARRITALLERRQPLITTVLIGNETANIAIAADRAAPGDGVYAGRVRRPGTHGPPMAAAISVGSNPQYAGTERRIEAHVLDEEDLDLYDAEIDVEFLTRLRGQQVFDSEAAFIKQMQADIRAARAIGEAPEAS